MLANANLYCISDAGKAVVPSSPAVLTMHAGSTVRTTGGGHGAGNITFGPIVLAGNATVSAASSDSSTLIFGGTISGPGSLSIPARANNNVVLSVANTFAGGVTVSSGSNNKLQATSNGAFGSGNVEVNANWSLVIDGGVSDAINDRAFLSLNGAKASGQAAKVVLNASETIMRLYVDGTQQPSGTYGSSSAVPAPDNVDDTLLSGAGVLTVPKQASLFRFR